MSPIAIRKENDSVQEIEIPSQISFIDQNIKIFEDWKEWLELSLSKNAIKVYSIHTWKMIVFLNKPIREITYTDLVRYIQNRDKEYKIRWNRELTTGTKNSIKASLRKFWKYLSLPGVKIVNENIAKYLEIKKIRTMGIGADKILSILEVKDLLEVAQENLRDFTLLATFYYSGLRRSELQMLEWESISFKENHIYVKNGKGDKPRHVTLHTNLARILQEFQEKTGDKSGIIFKSNLGKYLSRHTLAYICKKYSAKANIKRRFYPHMLRHTHATHRIANGDDIKRVSMDLGHESVRITYDLYVHPSKQERETGLDSSLPTFF